MNFRIGDILIGNPGKVNHPIIYWDKYQDENYFVGLALTHRVKGNIVLEDSHFYNKPPSNRDSFFVRRILLKPVDWGDFHQIGSLSSNGIEYVSANLLGVEPVFWEIAIEEYNSMLS